MDKTVKYAFYSWYAALNIFFHTFSFLFLSGKGESFWDEVKKYQRFLPSDCKDRGFGKLEFVAGI